MASLSKNNITLKCFDGKELLVDKILAVNSSDTIRRIFKRDWTCTAISLPSTISCDTLEKVMEYCSANADVNKEKRLSKDRDAQFVAKLGKETLRGLWVAADYLDIKGLRNLANQALKKKDKEEEEDDDDDEEEESTSREIYIDRELQLWTAEQFL